MKQLLGKHGMETDRKSGEDIIEIQEIATEIPCLAHFAGDWNNILIFTRVELDSK